MLVDANAAAGFVAAKVWATVRDRFLPVDVSNWPISHEPPPGRNLHRYPHPRETMSLFGHREAELALLNAYRSGRISHAWLIGGAQGIGKATLAYRMARFVLAHRDPLASRGATRRNA